MSGFTREKIRLPQAMIDFSLAIIQADDPAIKVRENETLLKGITPSEVVALFDALLDFNLPMPEMKKGVNKLMNLFHDTLNNADTVHVTEGSFPEFLIRNNAEMEARLKKLRPLIRKINANKNDIRTKKALLKGFETLADFEDHYILKEHILFPVLEQHWPDHGCLKVMWSFHDDIRRNRKSLIGALGKVELDLPKFNKLTGDLFFNMLAIKFREEKVLIPLMMHTVPVDEINDMLEHSRDFRYPYVRPEFTDDAPIHHTDAETERISLETGKLTAKQIKLLFNHLPVDVTFVDEYNKVQYYSNPPHRIFPRAKGIIGRDVKNCHPPESVHIVEEIIEEFRKGNQDKASFWIKMGQVYVLIQYFAVRDKKNRYCGVVEVAQEISEIKKIEGEQRLLDWSK